MLDDGVEPAIKWVIVWCDEDLSYSLINEDEAVCDVNHLSLDDAISFTYNNRKYEGVVRALGGDDDYDDLVVKLQELNATNKKRADSFHADRPRKARGGGKLVNTSKPETKSATPKPSQEDNVNMKIEQGSSENSGSPSTSPDSSPAPERMTDRAKAAVPAKRKGNENDLQILKKLRSVETPKSKPRQSIMGLSFSESPSGSGAAKLDKEDEPKLDDKKHQRDLTEKLSSEEENSKDKYRKRRKGAFSSSEEDSDEVDKKGKIKRSGKNGKGIENISSAEESAKEDKKGGDKGRDKTKKPSKKIGQGNKAFSSDEESAKEDKKTGEKKCDEKRTKEDNDEANGKVVKKEANQKKGKKNEIKKKNEVKEAEELDFPVMRCSADSDDVDAISGKSKELANKTFYITSESLHKAKSAKNASIFCKNLLEAAFTDEALYKCSLSGGEYRAGGRDKIVRKPALPSNVISVIIDVALHRQQVKKWNPQLNKKDLIGSLRQKLVDIRPRLKKMFEKKDV